MNSAEYVSNLLAKLKETGEKPQDIAWKIAKACTGWAYVYGARGQECTPSYRRSAYAGHGDDHPAIRSSCKNFDGNSTCVGCKWYPDKKRTRTFDCRGYTYWIIKQVYGVELKGAGATSQWNTTENWSARGTIDTMPKDTLVCLFYTKKGDPKVMAHTGLGLNGETIECSSGVQYFSTLNKKWTHWAVPKCVSEDVQPSIPDDATKLPPTLRKGDKGDWVAKLQELLDKLGYDLGRYGVDGDFGSATLKAVKKFQEDHGLTADGVVGIKTWQALLAEPAPTELYTVTIPHLSFEMAHDLAMKYAETVIVKEKGGT